jgi:hypothetical protein
MRIYLTDQSKQFPKHLEFMKGQSVMDYEKAGLVEKITIIPVDTGKELQELNTDFFFEYKIFPTRILTFLTQWNFQNREMRVGDTIVQQAFIPPFGRVSQKIIFGVRINEIIKEPNRIGFSYETLKGHVEKGVSIFTIERTDNKIVFKVHTFSSPGNFLTRLLGPILSVPYQAYCTRQGLLNVKRQLEKS